MVRAHVMTLRGLSFGLTSDQAAKLLKRLKERGALVQLGQRRWARYTLAAD